MNMNEIELLAPAGSIQTMKAAYKAGADAVYMGGERFGARAYAENPDGEGLLYAIDYAHLHGRRLYLTVNTLLKNAELESLLEDYLTPLYKQGLDAVIVQDMGVLTWIHERFPDLPIHASTQMTIFGDSYGKWLGRRGVTRIVTPREMDLEEIKAMKAETGLEIETFIHGALCYCYSGQCLMSSMLGGRSGNRGRCAQACRLPYSFESEQGRRSGYLLSPKDLCSLQGLPDLLEAGADSLKIEGRMKKPEYAALTTAIYRRYLDLYLEKGREGYRVQPSDIRDLMDLYNRGGFTDGYFARHNGREMMSVDRPNHSGVFAGKAHHDGKAGLRLRADTDLHGGDILEYGDKLTVKVEKDIPAGGSLRLKATGRAPKKPISVTRTRNEALIRQVTEDYVKNSELTEKIYGSVSISKYLPVKMELYTGGKALHISVEGEPAEPAASQPLTEEMLLKQLTKTGGTPFLFEKLDIHLEPGCYLNLRAINQLRRDALSQLERRMLADFRRNDGMENAQREGVLAASALQKEEILHGRTLLKEGDSPGRTLLREGDSPDRSLERKGWRPDLTVLVSGLDQLQAVLAWPEVRRIYFNDGGNDETILEALNRTHRAGREFYLAMPHVFRNDTARQYDRRRDILSLCDGFLARNMESLLLTRAWEKPCVTDYNMYCMNDRAAEVYLSMAESITLPVELNRRELAAMNRRGGKEWIVYGFMPLMISAQCLLKTTGKCTRQPSVYRLKDRLRKGFPVQNVCAFCYNLIYNTVPVYLLDLLSTDGPLVGAGTVRMQFLEETPGEIDRLMEACRMALRGEKPGAVIKDYTKGHYQRGIE